MKRATGQSAARETLGERGKSYARAEDKSSANARHFWNDCVRHAFAFELHDRDRSARMRGPRADAMPEVCARFRNRASFCGPAGRAPGYLFEVVEERTGLCDVSLRHEDFHRS